MKKKVLTEKFIKSVLLPKTGQEEHFDASLPGFDDHAHGVLPIFYSSV